MEEEFNEECSDEEAPIKTGYYEPSPEDIEKFYNLLDEGKFPEFNWKSPGYRPPTPNDQPSTPTREDDSIEDEKSDFDFMDEMSAPQLPVRREGEVALKGSAKKKTTSLDGVLSNMRRHRKLDQMGDNGTEKTVAISPSETSPVTTTTQ